MQGALQSRPDWMRRHRMRTLRNICLPGSHQSATYTVESTERHLPLAIGWTRCQRYDISEQLDAGIRFLDLSVTSAVNERDEVTVLHVESDPHQSLLISNRSFRCASLHLYNQVPPSFRQPHSVHSPPSSPHPAHITSSQSLSSLSPSTTPRYFTPDSNLICSTYIFSSTVC